MIYHKFENMYKKLVFSTRDGKLNWKPFISFKSRYLSGSDVLDIPLNQYFLHLENVCYGGTIDYDSSFYLKSNDDFLFLLDYYPPCSPSDGTPPEQDRIVQLIGGTLSPTEEVIIFPDYLNGCFEILLAEVKKYMKSLDIFLYYDSEVYRSLDFLQGFISE